MNKSYKEVKEMTVCLKSNTKRKEVKIKDMKLNISQIARDQGVSWPTAKKIVLGNTSRKKREFKGTSKLESYKDVIDYKLEMYQCSAVSIYDLISAKGYLGSKSLVTKYVKQKKENLLNKATIRVETTPGLQGQVDWKESLTLTSKSGEKYTINIFLFILSYSKLKYIELTIDRCQNTLFKCLINCFKYLEGVPEEIWFDNMKTVVSEHDINTNKVKFNDRFYEFSKNMMFTPIACKPYRPCTKGLAENLAKVMNRLKVYNEEFDSLDELIEIVKDLNYRLNHKEKSQATGEYPITLFIQKEKEYLNKVNLNQYDYLPSRQVRKVNKESMINLDKNKYSVPVEYLGKFVEIEIKDNQLYIYYNGELIREHKLVNSTHSFIYDKADIKQIIQSNYPKYSNDQIEEMANQRLQGYDILLDRKKRQYE